MSKPKLTLRLEAKTIKLKLPHQGATSVEVPGEVCPHCKADLVVAGAKRRIGGHDFYSAEAGCVACDTYVGELRLKVSTIFGLEEDERVLSGRCRVY